MTTSPGIRVLEVPKDASERDIKVYFSNPRHGGSKIGKIYYPLQSNDAVVLFQNGEASPKIFQQEHIIRGKTIKVRALQRQVFSKVTVELGADITALLDNDPKYLDDIQYDGELEVTSEDNYTITGDWYQIEWAWQYLDEVCNHRNETIESGLENGRERHSPVPVIQNGEPFGAHGYSSDTKDEELQPLSYPHHTEFSEKSGFQPYCYENWQDKHEYHQMIERTSESDYTNHFDFDNDDSALDLLTGGIGQRVDCLGGMGQRVDLPFIPQGHQHRGQQKGFTVSHQDFQDLPLTFDFNISTLNISIVMSDLLREKTDAIVSSASGDLSAQYGLSRVIARAADPKLKVECREHIDRHGPLSIGDVVHTSAGGTLDKKVGFVIHAVGPSWKESRTEESNHLLTCTYLNTLQYASNMWLQSISMPLIGAGGVGFPLDVCVQSLYDALLLFVTDEENLRHLKDVRLVLNDEDSTCATIVVLRSLLDVDQIATQEAAKDRYIERSSQFDFRAKNLSLDNELTEPNPNDSGTNDNPTCSTTIRITDDKPPNDETVQVQSRDITKKQIMSDSELDDEENILISIKDKSASFEKITTREQVAPIYTEPKNKFGQHFDDPETSRIDTMVAEKSMATNLNTSSSSDEYIPFGMVNSDDEDDEFTQTDAYSTPGDVHVVKEAKQNEFDQTLQNNHNVFADDSEEKSAIKDDWKGDMSTTHSDNTKSEIVYKFGSETKEHGMTDNQEHEIHLSSQETVFQSKSADNARTSGTKEPEKHTELTNNSTEFSAKMPQKVTDATKSVKVLTSNEASVTDDHLHDVKTEMPQKVTDATKSVQVLTSNKASVTDDHLQDVKTEDGDKAVSEINDGLGRGNNSDGI